MLEIIVLYFLTIKVGKLAALKGLKPLKWKLITIGAWLIAEVIGLIVGLMFFTMDNLFSLMLIAYGFAITSYYIINNYLNSLPQQFEP
ncbi:MAG: hypothetical protein ABIP68_02070 [Ferruginibacter sp.]